MSSDSSASGIDGCAVDASRPRPTRQWPVISQRRSAHPSPPTTITGRTRPTTAKAQKIARGRAQGRGRRPRRREGHDRIVRRGDAERALPARLSTACTSTATRPTSASARTKRSSGVGVRLGDAKASAPTTSRRCNRAVERLNESVRQRSGRSKPVTRTAIAPGEPVMATPSPSGGAASTEPTVVTLTVGQGRADDAVRLRRRPLARARVPVRHARQRHESPRPPPTTSTSSSRRPTDHVRRPTAVGGSDRFRPDRRRRHRESVRRRPRQRHRSAARSAPIKPPSRRASRCTFTHLRRATTTAASRRALLRRRHRGIRRRRRRRRALHGVLDRRGRWSGQDSDATARTPTTKPGTYTATFTIKSGADCGQSDPHDSTATVSLPSRSRSPQYHPASACV